MLAFKGFTGGHHPPHPHFFFFFYCLQYEKSTWPVKWNGPQPCREMSLPQRTSGLKFKGLPENKGVRRHFHIFIRSYWFPCRSWTSSPPPPLPRSSQLIRPAGGLKLINYQACSAEQKRRSFKRGKDQRRRFSAHVELRWIKRHNYLSL